MTTLITIHKAFIRPFLDHGGVLYDQAFSNSFQEKLDSIQYNVCLPLTGAVRGTTKEKFYQEMGLESLRDRRWWRKFYLFYKVLENENSKYFFSLGTIRRSFYSTQNIHNIPFLNTKQIFQKLFFSIDHINLDPCLRKFESFSVFKSNILRFIRPSL